MDQEKNQRSGCEREEDTPALSSPIPFPLLHFLGGKGPLGSISTCVGRCMRGPMLSLFTERPVPVAPLHSTGWRLPACPRPPLLPSPFLPPPLPLPLPVIPPSRRPGSFPGTSPEASTRP